MPRKIISHPTTGVQFSVTHAVFLSTYQALGFTEVTDEPDPPVYPAPVTYPAVDDAGAWDSGPFYYITHADGRVYGATYDNWLNRYEALGFEIGPGLGGEPAPTFLRLLTEGGDTLITEDSDTFMQEAA